MREGPDRVSTISPLLSMPIDDYRKRHSGPVLDITRLPLPVVQFPAPAWVHHHIFLGDFPRFGWTLIDQHGNGTKHHAQGMER